MIEYLFSTWWAIPLLIFLSRILDVSIGTVRLIFISKGLKNYAPILGFFEVIIWLLAVKKVMTNVADPLTYIAYGAGFASGTYIGMIIEEKVVSGKSLIRIITKNYVALISELTEENYPYTVVDAEGRNGKVKIIFMAITKDNVQDVMQLVKKNSPTAFYTIEDVRYARDNPELMTKQRSLFSRLGFHRKSK